MKHGSPRPSSSCHTSVCSSVLCLVTTKIWSNGHKSPRRVTALRTWTNRATALRQIRVTAPFYLEASRRDRERKERTHAGERVHEKALWLLLLYVFSSTWACPMQIGLSQECCLFCLKSSLWSSDLPCLLATAILDSFSLFYLPNIPPSRDGRPNSLGIGASRSFWLLSAELGWRGVLGLPLLLVSSLRVLIAVSKGV